MSEEDRPADVVEVLRDLEKWWEDPEPVSFAGGGNPEKIAGGKWDQPVPPGTQNPYWEIVRQLPLYHPDLFSGRPSPEMFVMSKGRRGLVVSRESLCRTFAWAIPSPGDIAWLAEQLGGRGVVEPGAGSGYWAWQLRQAGIDVAAYDPAVIEDNPFAYREWTTVLPDGHDAPRHHPGRALFLCWPNYSSPWAAHSLASYQGDLLLYCGEDEGGCCADDRFFALRDAEWDQAAECAAHLSYGGIHCYLTAWTRRRP